MFFHLILAAMFSFSAHNCLRYHILLCTCRCVRLHFNVICGSERMGYFFRRWHDIHQFFLSDRRTQMIRCQQCLERSRRAVLSVSVGSVSRATKYSCQKECVCVCARRHIHFLNSLVLCCGVDTKISNKNRDRRLFFILKCCFRCDMLRRIFIR